MDDKNLDENRECRVWVPEYHYDMAYCAGAQPDAHPHQQRRQPQQVSERRVLDSFGRERAQDRKAATKGLSGF